MGKGTQVRASLRTNLNSHVMASWRTRQMEMEFEPRRYSAYRVQRYQVVEAPSRACKGNYPHHWHCSCMGTTKSW